MHCHSYALETGKYLLRLENKIYTRCIQFVLVIYILRTDYLHIMYSFFYCYLHFTSTLFSLLCTILRVTILHYSVSFS